MLISSSAGVSVAIAMALNMWWLGGLPIGGGMVFLTILC